MKTAIGIALAVFLALFSIILMRGALIPVHASVDSWYYTWSFLGAPGGVFSGIPASVLVLGSILLVAVVLRRAFDRPRHDYPRERNTSERKPDDLAILARDLDRVARRLEERVEALETILLDRDRARY